MNKNEDNFNRARSVLTSIVTDPALQSHITPEFNEKIQTCIAALQGFKERKSLNSQSLREEALHILRETDDAVSKLDIKPNAVKRIHDAIVRVSSIISTEKSDSLKREKVDAKLALFFDIDEMDHNGAVANYMHHCLRSGTPFIVSRSCLQGSGWQQGSFTSQRQLLQPILDSHKEWLTYQHIQLGSESEFVVFIPRDMANGKTDAEVLKGFDLLSDGSVVKINLSRVLEPPTKRATIDSLFQMFDPNPRKSKLLSIVGHSDQDCVASLTTNDYKSFLEFAKRQKCLGLTITGCETGGQSSLIHIPDDEESSLAEPSTDTALTFPVIVRSIGDFAAKQIEEAEFDITGYFNGLQELIESKGGKTVSEFRDMINKAENGKFKSSPKRLQVYLPHSSKSLGGFRPVDEINNSLNKPKKESYSLTYAKMRKAELETSAASRSIKIENKAFLGLSPLVIDIPLEFISSAPALFSMIPGNAHHFIKQIKTETEFSSMISLINHEYVHASHSSVKGFFVHEIIANGKALHQVAILVDKGKVSYTYLQEGKFYFSGDGEPQEISSFRHASSIQKWIEATTPSSKAVKSQTGGQQNEESFITMMTDPDSWGGEDNLMSKFCPILNCDKLKNLKGDELIQLIEKDFNPLSQEDKNQLAHLLLRASRSDLVRLLLENKLIEPECKSYDGQPLIVEAGIWDELELVQELLNKGGDPNIRTQSGMSCLHEAALKTDPRLLRFLLSVKNIDINPREPGGETPVAYALQSRNPENLQLLIDAGADVNSFAKIGDAVSTNLGLAVLQFKSKIPALLKAGAKPNLGYASALFLTLIQGDVGMMEQLFQNGGHPFRGSSGQPFKAGDRVLFFEAIRRSSRAMIDLFLNHKDFDPNAKIGKYSPLMVAIERNRADIVRLLFEKGAELESDRNFDERDYPDFCSSIFKFMEASDDFSLAEVLVANKAKIPAELARLVNESIAEYCPELAEKLINSKEMSFDDNTKRNK